MLHLWNFDNLDFVFFYVVTIIFSPILRRTLSLVWVVYSL